MNSNFILDSILKFHQLSNPLISYSDDSDIDMFLLQNNSENYPKLSFQEYNIKKLSTEFKNLDFIINNFNKKDSSYFIVYSFYNTKLIQSGNYAYNNDGTKIIKYSELNNTNTEYQLSISFFVSLFNSVNKYGSTGFIKSVCSIGEVLGRIKLFCNDNSVKYLEEMKNFNISSSELGVDSLKQLYINTIYIKDI